MDDDADPYGEEAEEGGDEFLDEAEEDDGNEAPARRRRKKFVLKPKGASRKRLPAWVVSMLAPVAVTLVLALVGWMVHSTINSQNRMSGGKPVVVGAPREEKFAEKAPILARRFAEANSPEEWLSMVRDPERVGPMVQAFRPEVAVGKPIKVSPHGSEQLDEMEVLQFLVTYEDGRSRLIHVLPTEDGPKVDWESFARSGSTDFAGMSGADELPDAEIRVLVRPGNYYNYDFADDRQWIAFELTNGDWPETFTGYARADSPAARALSEITTDDAPPKRALLRVRGGGENGPRRQCEILEVLHLGWVKP